MCSDFESSHFTGQLAERLNWAVHDADLLAEQEPPAEEPPVEEPPVDEVAPPGLTVLAS